MSSFEQANGIGVLTFYAGGACTALIRPVSPDHWHRGKYIPNHGVDIESDVLRLQLRPTENPADGAPRLRGQLLVKATGEQTRVAAWRANLEDGTPCLGLSADRPMPLRIASPF